MLPEIVQKILEKNKEDYEKIASEFSATRAYLWPELKKFGQYVQDGDTVLDLGCGNGRLCELFKEKSVKYIGLDSSPKLIEIAKKKYPGFSFQVADARDLPFEKDTFDTCFSIALLHHIPSEELRLEVLSETRRVLRPGGTLIVTCWNLYQINYWNSLIKYTLSKIFRKEVGGLHFGVPGSQFDFGDVFIPWKLKDEVIQRYYHAFTLRELRGLVERMDFKIIDQFYSEKGRRTNWWAGYNIVLVAQKR